MEIFKEYDIRGLYPQEIDEEKAYKIREESKEEAKQEHSSYIYSHTTKHLTLLTKSKRSQSALEYMMTYGWAILIIVIVAVILYSMGIFNPSCFLIYIITLCFFLFSIV